MFEMLSIFNDFYATGAYKNILQKVNTYLYLKLKQCFECNFHSLH